MHLFDGQGTWTVNCLQPVTAHEVASAQCQLREPGLKAFLCDKGRRLEPHSLLHFGSEHSYEVVLQRKRQALSRPRPENKDAPVSAAVDPMPACLFLEEEVASSLSQADCSTAAPCGDSPVSAASVPVPLASCALPAATTRGDNLVSVATPLSSPHTIATVTQHSPSVCAAAPCGDAPVSAALSLPATTPGQGFPPAATLTGTEPAQDLALAAFESSESPCSDLALLCGFHRLQLSCPGTAYLPPVDAEVMIQSFRLLPNYPLPDLGEVGQVMFLPFLCQAHLESSCIPRHGTCGLASRPV